MRNKQALLAQSEIDTSTLSMYENVDNWDAYRYEHCRNVRARARRNKLEFSINPEEIIYPEFCPILGILITRKLGRDNHPSLDRINNSRGYVKGNVRIISNKANAMKREHTLETFERFIQYIKGEL